MQRCQAPGEYEGLPVAKQGQICGRYVAVKVGKTKGNGMVGAEEVVARSTTVLGVISLAIVDAMWSCRYEER